MLKNEVEYARCSVCGHRVRIKFSKGEGFRLETGRFIGKHFKRSYDWKHCPGSEEPVKDAATQP